MTHPAATPENTRRGIVAGIGAYLIWGLVPIFFKQIVEVPADEIIAHRVVWAMLLMTAILGVGRGFGDALRVARIPAQLARIALAAALVISNWLTFVWGVNNGHIIETSLGYFILPLLNVALGVLVLKERLRPLQWVAVLLAAAGVAIEALRAGGLPWIALVLAGTFAIYGLLRKQLPLDAASGLFLETACMTPVALLWLAWIWHSGTSHFGTGANLFDGRDLLLVATGAITAIPLLLFAVAARRLPLSMIAFLQYIAPSIAFLIAVLVYHEPMDFTRTLAFAAIWSGLAVYSVDLLKFTSAKADAPAAMSFDSAQFKRLERKGYNRIGARYLAAAGSRGELAAALLAAAGLGPGQRVLDLASGPGLLAGMAQQVVGASGLAVASDISEGQLACCPGLARVAADGEALPFADGSFERVVCGLGLMFFPDDHAALREMRRVLRPDGRLALSVWGAASEVPLVEAALSCMRRLLPPPKVARPSIFRFGDAGELDRRLASADFCDRDIRPCRFTVEFADATAYWQGFLDLAGGAAESLSRVPPEKQRELAIEVAEELAPHAVAGGFRLTSTVLVATARPV